MIGRSLRASVDLTKLGHHTLVVDCDVIQADGGTRTAAISGGYTALRLALQKMVVEGELSEEVFLPPVAAISVGVVDDQPMVDLNYHEDSRADIDVNVVMNQAGEFIEIQGTAEKAPFSRNRLDILLDLAESGILQVLEAQNEVYQKKNR
jgi:ribonuclease PH